MAEGKQYIENTFIREKVFGDGGSVLNCCTDADTFIAAINANRDERGQFRFVIGKRKQPSQGGVTHWCAVDTWKPAAKQTDTMPE